MSAVRRSRSSLSQTLSLCTRMHGVVLAAEGISCEVVSSLRDLDTQRSLCGFAVRWTCGGVGYRHLVGGEACSSSRRANKTDFTRGAKTSGQARGRHKQQWGTAQLPLHRCKTCGLAHNLVVLFLKRGRQSGSA